MQKNSYLFHSGISFLYYFGMGCYMTVLAVYLSDLHLDPSQVGMITSSAPLFTIFTTPLLGQLSDKVRSPRKVAITTLLITVALTLIFISTKQFILLLLAGGLFVSFMNALTPITDQINSASPHGFNRIRIFGSVGFALAAQISGYIYASIASIAPFIIFILSVFFLIYCICQTFDPTITIQKSYNAKEAYKALFKNKNFIQYLFICIFFWGFLICHNTFVTMYFIAIGGTTSQAGTYQLIATMFEIPAIFLSSKLFQKIGVKKGIMIALIGSMANFLWYATLPPVHIVEFLFIFKPMIILFPVSIVHVVPKIVDENYLFTAYALIYTCGQGIASVITQLIGGYFIKFDPSMSLFYLFLASLALIAFLLAIPFKNIQETN